MDLEQVIIIDGLVVWFLYVRGDRSIDIPVLVKNGFYNMLTCSAYYQLS